MSKTTKLIVLTLSFVLATFAVVGGLGVRANTNDDGSYRQLGVYSEVLSRIRTEYVEEPNIPSVTSGALHGLLESLDANSSYLDPTEYKDYKQRKEGKAGIGAAVSKRYGYAAVISVIPGGPADKADIESGDIIEAIEGKTTRDMSLAEIDGLLTGTPGSVVNVSVVRPRRAQPVKSELTRAIVVDPPISDKMMEDGIAYIKVDDFPKGRSQEIANKLKAVQKEGAKKIILDLRNSGDGEENEGIATANLFLNHGTITYLQGQKYPKQIFNADPEKAVTSLPLVVLVNRGTAGAAEIVAAAVMENARGDVVGDKTFGSGSIQKVIDMPDGSALVLSVAKYYSPSGKAVQDAAVTPNILVADNNDDFIAPDEDENAPEDAQQEKQQKANQPDDQLNRAIEVLKNQGKKA
ncbi:MAG: S41 family peptidase [Candidatus Korobacteraceae bacterium]|jgi:carboxyl-terminal processing protease